MRHLDPAAIVGRLEHHGLRLAALFNTHGHIDHIGGVGSLVHGLEHGDEIEVRIHDGDKHMLPTPSARAARSAPTSRASTCARRRSSTASTTGSASADAA